MEVVNGTCGFKRRLFLTAELLSSSSTAVTPLTRLLEINGHLGSGGESKNRAPLSEEWRAAG